LPLTKLSESEAEEVARILEAGLLEGEHLGSNGIGKYAVFYIIGFTKLSEKFSVTTLGNDLHYNSRIHHLRKTNKVMLGSF